MTVPDLTATQLAGSPDLPLLICGPSLGTSVTALWGTTAARLARRFHVVGWDLPGHGSSAAAKGPFSMADLAQGVLSLAERLLDQRGEPGGSFGYAGDSVGGAVGLQLLLDAPERVTGAVVLCSGARIGTPESWHERAATVRASGTPVMVAPSSQRWFGPGFIEREPAISSVLLHSLQETDKSGYAATCEALAAFDVRARLGEITTPVLAVAGDHDVATPVPLLADLVTGLLHGRLVVLPGVAHLAPAEAPAEVAALIQDHLGPAPVTLADRYDAGLAVRREVLGDAHVDRATSAATDFTRDFQEFITDYAWGGIWTRPGLDRRSRSLITLTALVARGHHDELAMHVRAARTNGLTDDEIKELLLQTAIYCGVPDANTAFRIAQGVLAEGDEA
ncbi:4-carboxymuconolactone decarboxylase / 3-oxoadipate enol-lactonase [metagenome]|uniref:4-carboxymuconolactone decarboxylase / 3-oxoadipate enol-lactonase n=1 Tax=metagenome TaxID=256318 RepID=A0A2P2C9P1_9ZZZZ